MFRHKNTQELALVAARFAVGSVFFWFGIDKLIRPELWFAWVPAGVAAALPFSLTVFMTLNGFFEIAVGVALISGRYIRVAAAAAAAFLVGIILTIGSNEVTVRDTAMLGACIVVIVMANASAKKPLPEKRLSQLVWLYGVFLLVTGILYLRHG